MILSFYSYSLFPLRFLFPFFSISFIKYFLFYFPSISFSCIPCFPFFLFLIFCVFLIRFFYWLLSFPDILTFFSFYPSFSLPAIPSCIYLLFPPTFSCYSFFSSLPFLLFSLVPSSDAVANLIIGEEFGLTRVSFNGFDLEPRAFV